LKKQILEKDPFIALKRDEEQKRLEELLDAAVSKIVVELKKGMCGDNLRNL
jgi:hypothetical protein